MTVISGKKPIPGNQLATATANSPGAAPHWPPTSAETVLPSGTTTANVPDSTDKRYCTDAQKTVIGNTSGANSGDETKATLATKTGITQAQMDLVALGAKATVAVTLVDYSTWADGMTIVTPTVGAKTIKKTSTGDIDVSGAANLAAATAIIDAYLTSAAGSVVDVVTTGSTMTITAKAYGTTLNGTVISGTLLSASGTMGSGLAPQISNPPPLATANSPGAAPHWPPTSGESSLPTGTTTANVPDSIDKRYCTDAQKTVIGNTSGVNTGDETKATIATKTGITQTQLNALALIAASETAVQCGADLTDADATVQPFTDKVSQYTLPASTLSTNRTLTLGTTSAFSGLTVRIVRRDRTANTYSIGTLFTFPASPTADMEAVFQHNGSYWLFIGAEYIQ